MADPVIEGRSLVLEAIRALAIACRARAAYPSVHPNVTKAVSAAQARVGQVLAVHGSVGIGVGRAHLRVGVWTLDSPQARALAEALYLRQVAVLRIDRGVAPGRAPARSCSGSRARSSRSSPGPRPSARPGTPPAVTFSSSRSTTRPSG